ncbi:tetratricopeptide repeat protein [bacterium]|nr:tetratricopeptide repeat protein [bacterium]
MAQKILKGYRIEKLIGKGGMAAIYLAENMATREQVALKVLLPHIASDQEYVMRFVHEVRANKKLQHPNIVQILDCDEVKGNYFMAMEYIHGYTLQDLLKKVPILPVSAVLYLIREILEGLKFSHTRKIVHRDMKPSNILMSYHGQVKISDFGISKTIDFTRLTQTGNILGTPAYMSPEQGRGKAIDTRSDIFSVGIIMFECLSGENPFFADNPTTAILNILQKDPPALSEINPTVSPALERIIELMIKKNVEDRYQTIESVLKDLFEYELHEIGALDRDTFKRLMEKPDIITDELDQKQSESICEKAEKLYVRGPSYFNQALWEYHQAHFLDPQNSHALERMKEICQKQQFNLEPRLTPKLEELEKSVRDNPYNITILSQLAKLHRIEGNFFQVIKYYRRLVKLKPSDGYLIGQMESLIGDKTLVRTITGSLWSDSSTKTASGTATVQRTQNTGQSTLQRNVPLVDLVTVKSTQRGGLKSSKYFVTGILLFVALFLFGIVYLLIDSMSDIAKMKGDNFASVPDLNTIRHAENQLDGHVPTEIERELERAESALQNKDFIKARDLFSALSKKYPESMTTLATYRLAIIERELGNYDTALDQIEYLLSLNPGQDMEVYAHRERAQIYSIQKEFYDAEREYEEVIDNLESVPEVEYQVQSMLDYAKFLKAQRRYDDALEVTQNILETYSGLDFQKQARMLRAELFAEQDEIDQALKEYNLILKNLPVEDDETIMLKERIKMLTGKE